MSPRAWARRALLVPAMAALASGVLYAGACGGEGNGSSGASTEEGIDDVLYEGGATDEALIALLAAEPKSDASQGTVFDAPEDGATVPGDTPLTLSFRVRGAADWAAPPAGPALRRAAGAVPAAGDAAAPRAPVWAELGALLGPVRAARAHGTPVNGRAYFLVFSTAERPGLLRVFTTNLTYTPDAAAWNKLRAAGAPITVQVTNAVFETNRIAPGGGPFLGEPVTFSIQP